MAVKVVRSKQGLYLRDGRSADKRQTPIEFSYPLLGDKEKSGQTPTGITVAQLLNEWWLPRIRTEVEQTTLATIECHIRRYLIPRFGLEDIAELTTEEIRSFYIDLYQKPVFRGRPLKKGSIHRVHATLHWALEHALQAGLIDRNPARHARLRERKSDVPEARIWSARDLCRFLDGVRTDSQFALWMVLAHTGMRRGEALGLKWGDVDFRQRTVRVCRARCEVAGTVYVSRPKSGRSRSLCLDRETAAVLRRHRGRKPPAADSWCFTTDDGEPLRPTWVTNRFRALVSHAGVPTIRLHDLRHTHASHLLLSGAGIKVVQERLGHADAVITLNLYAHLMPNTQREAIDSMASLYAP